MNGSQILAEITDSYTIAYIYDAYGSPIGMQYKDLSDEDNAWEVYWYGRNLQGDIVAVYNSAGTKVATYTYSDAWGNHSVTYTNGGASTAAQYNPFRYRGYYYHTDLGMYYLQSRYYDPNTCRFINADGYVSTGQGILGNNMFAYCGNNPVNYVDYSGESAIGMVLLLLLGITALGAFTSCDNSVVKDVYDTYSDINDLKGFGEDSVQFGKDLTVYQKYMYSYSTAVSRYYQTNTNELYWDEYLEEAFSGNQERCINLIEGDINMLETVYKEHLPHVNNVDYLYEHFNEWAYYGRTGIVEQSLKKPAKSGIKWYKDIWEFIFGSAN